MSLLAIIIVCAYSLAILGGTAWLVGWHGWSPWWFLLAVLLVASFKSNKDGE